MLNHSPIKKSLRSTSRLFLTILLTIGLLAAVQGCNKPSTEPKGEVSTQSRTPVRLATAKNVWNALPLIADEEGFFVQEGLAPTLEYLSAGRYCLDALLSKSADLGFIVEVNVAYLGYTADQSVSVVATVARSEDSAVVARRSSGIRVPADLRGKTLALSPGTTSDVFAHRLLTKHRLQPEDLNLLNIQPNGMFAAATSGQVDAASTWEPFVHNITKALGSDAVVFRDSSAYRGYMNLAARRDWAATNTPILLAVLKSLRRAEEFARNQPDVAKAIVARRINLDRETVDAIWPMFDLHVTLDQEGLARDIAAEGQWIRTAQQEYKGRELPDYSRYIDPTYFPRLTNPSTP